MAYPASFVEFFGPCTWKTVHAISFTYASDPERPSPQEKKAATDFFNSLAFLIPCPACRVHYSKFLAENPVDVSSREALSLWLYNLHSDVNARRNAPNPSFDEVKRAYTHFNPNENASLSDGKRLRLLADPHLLAAPKGAEGALGELVSSDRIVAVVLFGAVASGMLFYLAKRRKNLSS